MNNEDSERWALARVVRVAALAGCAMVSAMLVVFVARGVGQDPLQFVHPPDVYAAILGRDPGWLRLVIGLDNAFIAFYATMFVALGPLLVARGAPRVVARAAIGLLLATAALDLVENVHFMTMLATVAEGGQVGAGEIGYQVGESLLKFHASYVGLFLLGFAIPRDTRAGRALAWASWYVQLPVGILIYVTPPQVSFALVLARLAYFVLALIGVTRVFPVGRPAAGAPGRQIGLAPAPFV
jgi:hypothetical protein